jgi:hypothetical protein
MWWADGSDAAGNQEEQNMAALNVVRLRVKRGQEKRFIDHHRKAGRDLKGFVGGTLIKTGTRSYCMVGEWKNMKSIVAARPQMIAMLDGMRHMLEDLGGGLGVTDPVSGEAVLRIGGNRPGKPARKKLPVRKKK